MTTILEELQNSTEMTLASSGDSGSLLNARIASGMAEMGCTVHRDGPAPQGLHGQFNPRCAGISMNGETVRPAGPQPEAPKPEAAGNGPAVSTPDMGM